MHDVDMMEIATLRVPADLGYTLPILSFEASTRISRTTRYIRMFFSACLSSLIQAWVHHECCGTTFWNYALAVAVAAGRFTLYRNTSLNASLFVEWVSLFSLYMNNQLF